MGRFKNSSARTHTGAELHRILVQNYCGVTEKLKLHIHAAEVLSYEKTILSAGPRDITGVKS